MTVSVEGGPVVCSDDGKWLVFILSLGSPSAGVIRVRPDAVLAIRDAQDDGCIIHLASGPCYVSHTPKQVLEALIDNSLRAK